MSKVAFMNYLYKCQYKKKSNFHLQSFRFKELYGSVSDNVNESITTLTPCLESAVVVFGKIVEISSIFNGEIVSIHK